MLLPGNGNLRCWECDADSIPHGMNVWPAENLCLGMRLITFQVGLPVLLLY